ncbi:MAG: NhaA family Na+:H+ antiporter [Candidatus Paceibacteria bacterium]
MSQPKKGFVNFLQEFSIPLIVGVFAALFAANLAPDWYSHWFGEIHGSGAHGDADHGPFNLGFSIFGHVVGMQFLVNDIFMVFFFGIAAKEITEACLPGGSLNPLKSAISPLLATIGGVVGPVGAFFLFLALWYGASPDAFGGLELGTLQNGWGIPTATDIALAWLVARTVFGKGHPAVNFLLLLAVADDAIGLGIIAIFYGDPANPAKPEFLALVLLAMGVAFALRKLNVNNWIPYIFIAGPIAWAGLMLAHLHPALALVPIVPFLPGPKHDTGLFTKADEVDQAEAAGYPHGDHSPLHLFEHQLKLFVDFGLFFFAFANAGVELGGIGAMSWIILGSLVIGKTVGITAFAMLGKVVGVTLPKGMSFRDLVMAGFIGALGLTVALFVAGAAFPGADEGIMKLQGEAKMGALFSGFVGLAAVLIGKMFGFGRDPVNASEETGKSEAA